jgi:hypothetical protein
MSRGESSFGRAACIAALCLFAQTASAQGDARARAEAPFKEGVALHDRGKDVDALKKFEEAYAIYPSPNILFNVARMEQVTGNAADALKHYRQCLKDSQLTAENRAAAQEHVKALEKNFGRISVDAPAGSKVSADGAAPEDASEPMVVAPGRHKIEVTNGSKKETRDVEVGAGELAVVKFTFAASSAAPLVTAPAPAPSTTSAPLTNPGDYPSPPPEKTFWTTGHIVGLSAAVVGLAGIGIGAGFLAGAGSAKDKLDALKQGDPSNTACQNPSNPGCAERRDLEDTRVSDTNLGIGLVTAGAVLVVSGAITFFVWPSPQTTAQRAVKPVVGQNQWGLSFEGTW